MTRISTDQFVSFFSYARIHLFCTLQFVNHCKVSTFVQSRFVAPVGTHCIKISNQDVWSTVVFVKTNCFLAICSCLRQLFGRSQYCCGSVCFFSFLHIVCFQVHCFVKEFHSTVNITFLKCLISTSGSSFCCRFHLVSIVRCLQISFAFSTFHHFHDVDNFLQVSQVSLVSFYFRSIDVLQ